VQNGIHFGMQSVQVAVRMTQDVAEQLDALVASGAYESRAAAIRAGIEVLVASEERARIDCQMVEGYTQHPQTEEEISTAWENLRRSIEEEPW
jgi:Arc/MetJ-type ribon-helix-helix transcriptional regulator